MVDYRNKIDLRKRKEDEHANKSMLVKEGGEAITHDQQNLFSSGQSMQGPNDLSKQFGTDRQGYESYKKVNMQLDIEGKANTPSNFSMAQTDDLQGEGMAGFHTLRNNDNGKNYIINGKRIDTKREEKKTNIIMAANSTNKKLSSVRT